MFLNINSVSFKLFKIGVYFSAKSKKSSVYSSFFLLGYREKFAFLSLHGVSDQIRNFYLFFKSCHRFSLDFWILAQGLDYLKIVWWLSNLMGISFLVRMSQKWALCWWRGWCFLYKLGEICGKVFNMIGIDIAVVVGNDFDGFFETIGGFLAKGFPIITLSPASWLTNWSIFSFYSSEDFPGTLIFYSRLISYLVNR